MRYTLIWKPAVEQRLAQIWTAAADRRAVTEAADKIDEVLRTRPLAVGESRDEGRRILIEEPLVVVYRVLEEDCMVNVLGVKMVP
jgi:hypothetical protein